MFTRSRLVARAAVAALTLLCGARSAQAQGAPPAWEAHDHDIAARFAPIFHQGVVGSGRFDYITNFDFDGDWAGDNNWKNAADTRYPLKAYVYYAVSETPTHYLIHYAAFHPRDYKGGEATGALMSQAVRRGARASKRVIDAPIVDDVVLAHENDLEGCLVVVEKRGAGLDEAVVVAVETLAHNKYLKYQSSPTIASGIQTFELDGQHPRIYIEPKGHGMQAWANQPLLSDQSNALPIPLPGASSTGAQGGANGTGLAQRLGGLVGGINQARKLVNNEGAERIRLYRHTGTAEDPDATDGEVGYALTPTFTTLWPRARGSANPSFAVTQDFGTRTVTVATSGSTATRTVALGVIGSSFRGLEGAANMARPPWGWFDMTERNQPAGQWFLDPASVVVRHFQDLAGASTAYVHQPFLGVFRTTP